MDNYLFYDYENYLNSDRNKSHYLYKTKNELLARQKGRLDTRTKKAYSKSIDKERGEAFLGQLMQNPNILTRAYKQADLASSKGETYKDQDWGIDAGGYTSLRKLAEDLTDKKVSLERMLSMLGDLNQNLITILSQYLVKLTSEETFNEIAISILNEAGKDLKISTEDANRTFLRKRILETLYPSNRKTGEGSLLYVPASSKESLDTSTKRAIALIEALGDKMAVQQLVVNSSQEDSSYIFERIIKTILGLLSNVKGSTKEAVSTYGLATALNETKEILDNKIETYVEHAGKDFEFHSSAAYENDAKALKQIIENFRGLSKSQQKSDINVKMSNNTVSLSYGISEKAGKINPKTGTFNMKLVDETSLLRAIDRANLYNNRNFMYAFMNASVGKARSSNIENKATKDWRAGLEMIKYGSFLQHIAGSGKKSNNVLFISIGNQVFSVSQLLDRLMQGSLNINTTYTPNNLSRDTYKDLNKWVSGKPDINLGLIRSAMTQTKLLKALYSQKVTMFLSGNFIDKT